jgi:preprotein translocase subunit SecG
VAFITGILNALLILTSLFMICLILIQRGKGGGLAGAFGGMGGSSAFGTKAGDVFTKVTIWVAVVWGTLAMLLVFQSNRGVESAWGSDSSASSSRTVDRSTTGGSKAKGTPGDVPPPPVRPGGSGKSGAVAPLDSGAGPIDLPAIPDEPPPGKSK